MPKRYKVGEVELTAPIAPLFGCEDYDGLHLLVRYEGRPVGWLDLEGRPGPFVSAVRIRRELMEQLGLDLVAVVLRQEFTAPLDQPPPTPISVVVCTRDRPDQLARCLDSLFAVDYPAFEVLVVDNVPTTDATARLVERWPVRYSREDRPGLDWARNRGWRETTHALIAYADDDVRVDPGWLRSLNRAFAEPDVMAVTGLVAPAELETAAQVHFETDYGGMGKGLTTRRFVRETLSPRDLVASYRVGVGANMAFRRRTLEALGGFDTALDVGTPASGAGDLDMFHRVMAAGYALRYEPTALAWHYHRRDMESLRQQLYNDGRSFGVYLLKLWRSGSLSRSSLARFALGHWTRGLIGRWIWRAVHRRPLPLSLLWAGVRGAFAAPWAYAITYRQDRRIRQARPAALPGSTR